MGQSFVFTKTGTTAAQRKKAYKEFDNASNGILVTNYHSFLNDTDIIKSMHIDFVVIDEVHSVKARTGKLNNNITKVTMGKPTVFLTGTPIMSKPEDIFGIVQMVDPNYFGQWTNFKNYYLTVDLGGRYGPRVVGAKHLDELRDKVQDIVIRRTEYEVSIQLPKTIIDTVLCQMDSTQEELLKAIAEDQDSITTSIDKLKINGKIPDYNQAKAEQLEGRSKGLIAARQAASTDPRLFLRSTSKMMRDVYGKLIPSSYKMSDKTESIIDKVEDILASGDKVILFTKFRTCAQMISEDIHKQLKENVLLYTGMENDQQRDMAVDYFKNTTTYNVLIGTEAMAEGWTVSLALH